MQTEEAAKISTDKNGRCTHCGAKVKATWHPINPGLAMVLVKMYRQVKSTGENEVTRKAMIRDQKMEPDESGNLTKLRFNGLIAKIKDEEGRHKKGHWLITRRGFAFLRGEPVIAFAKTFRNVVIDHSEETITIGEILRGIKQGKPYWDDIEHHTARDR